MDNANEPAMPCKVTVNREKGEFQPYQFGNDDFEVGGLTKREEFAKAFMQSIIAAKHEEIKWWPDEVKQQTFAESAVAYADALLAELAKEES